MGKNSKETEVYANTVMALGYIAAGVSIVGNVVKGLYDAHYSPANDDELDQICDAVSNGGWIGFAAAGACIVAAAIIDEFDKNKNGIFKRAYKGIKNGLHDITHPSRQTLRKMKTAGKAMMVAGGIILGAEGVILGCKALGEAAPDMPGEQVGNAVGLVSDKANEMVENGSSIWKWVGGVGLGLGAIGFATYGAAARKL